MSKNEKIYDKNGTLLKQSDIIDDEGATLEIHWDEWYICGKRDMWKVEQFTLESYKDGYLLPDFQKNQG